MVTSGYADRLLFLRLRSSLLLCVKSWVFAQRRKDLLDVVIYRRERNGGMVIVLMGVTGSGKTTIGTLLSGELSWKYYDADDFHSPANIGKMEAGVPLDDGDRAPWLEALCNLIRGCIARGEDAVLACSALKKSYRSFLRVDDTVELIYLKGDYELIKKRLIARRGHYMNPALLDSQFETLEEPEDAIQVDVTSSPDEIVRTIRKNLAL